MNHNKPNKDIHTKANIERFDGFADSYNLYRPSPPLILTDILTRLAETNVPDLVVDLGSGTGLSTRLWLNKAKKIIGIEPNPDMRQQAEANTKDDNGMSSIEFHDGISTDTGLPNESADIVTCSQSLHWMDPEPTFQEIARILRSGGVFAAYDCDWPPTHNWEIEKAYEEFINKAEALQDKLGIYDTVKRWDKDKHIIRMKQSGRFRYIKEIVVHNIEHGNADRLIGLSLSQGGVATLLKKGLGEEEIGLCDLRSKVKSIIGDREIPWYFSYRVRIGIK